MWFLPPRTRTPDTLAGRPFLLSLSLSILPILGFVFFPSGGNNLLLNYLHPQPTVREETDFFYAPNT